MQRPGRGATAEGFRSLTPAARLLVVNGFFISLGFFMVLPYLATYLRDDLGFATALVGFVLGLRVLSQQGLYILGGTAADRLGARPMIIAGCALRVLAFGMFALFTRPAWIIAATVLIGVAGAVFNPASRAYLVQESPGRRAEAFSVFEVASNLGALLGPLLGASLLWVDFRLVALVASAVFFLLTTAQVIVLPRRDVATHTKGIVASWWEVVGNVRFLAFAIAGAAYFALFNQLYLALPLEAQRVTGIPAAVSAVFVVSTIVAIASQVSITNWCRARWPPGQSLATGLATMGLGFTPMLVSAPLTAATSEAANLAAGLTAMAPVLLGTIVLSIGMAITYPFIMDLLPVVGSERLVGTYYGWFYLVSAIVTTGVSVLVGRLLELTAPSLRWTPFAALVVVGLLGGAAVAIMQRRRLFEPSHVPASEAR